jgi:hypothetical protein
MRFDTAVEVTTSQLRIELMFPADDNADAYFRATRRRDGTDPSRSMGHSGGCNAEWTRHKPG